MENYRYELLLKVAEKAIEECRTPDKSIMLPRWPQFNELTGGLRKHELTLITAPTGAGKTQWNANLSMQLMLMGVPQFIASVETGATDFLKRIFSALTAKDFNSGDVVPDERITQLINTFGHLFERQNIYFSKYEDRVTSEQMIETLDEVHLNHGVEVAILDNLNFFLKVTATNYEKAEMDEAIHRFVMMAKRLPMHIILVVHPKKTEGDGRVENEYDIKGSSTAVQEASNVMLLNRPCKQDLEDKRYRYQDRELKFCKLRKRGQNVGRKIFFGFESGAYQEL